MLKIIYLSAILCCFISSSATKALAQRNVQVNAEELSRADTIIEGYLKENHVPGALVSVISDGQLIHTFAYGLANVEHRVPVTDSTVFEIGSISKQFVSAVILLLQEEERVNLGDPIHAFLPWLPGAWQGVTIKQLLHHTSGIPDYEQIAGYDIYKHRLTPEKIIQIAHSRPMDFEPGQGWSYSNTGYFLLSLLIEQLEGSSLERVLKKRIFDPLGMGYTEMADPEEIIQHRASGYILNRAGTLENRPASMTSAILGAGGIVSTAADMGKWDAALAGDDLLTSESKELMWKPVRLPNDAPTMWPWGDAVNYGLGWEVMTYRGSLLQTHSGQTAGFVAQFMRFPEQGISIIAFLNMYDVGAWPPARAMADFAVPGLESLKE